MTRHRYAALRFDPTTRASTVLGFLLAENVPDANLRAWRRFAPDASASVQRLIFCRAARRSSKANFRTVRLTPADKKRYA